MKILLLKDVAKVGKKGEIVETSVGYGRNFLIARKLGAEATQEKINAATLANAAQDHKNQVEKDEAKSLAKELNGKSVSIKAKTGDNGRLFGAVTSKEIAGAVRDQLRVEIDRKNIELKDGSIKTLGFHDAILRVYADTTAQITVEVIDE